MRISVVVITSNEERMISNCLDTLRSFDEIVVVDNGSKDSTVDLAKRAGAKIVHLHEASFAESRNAGMKAATGDWILYIDADERVTPALAHEIREKCLHPDHQAYAIRRQNILYGKAMQHGGWEKDSVVRLFAKTALRGWAGEVHEHAEVVGSVGELSQLLVHFTHRNMEQGLRKTIVWTPIEAQLFIKAGSKRISALSMLSAFFKSFLSRMLFQRAFKDGEQGVIEAFVQAMNRFIVMEQVWEMQQKPSLDAKYEQYERELAEVWGKRHKN